MGTRNVGALASGSHATRIAPVTAFPSSCSSALLARMDWGRVEPILKALSARVADRLPHVV